MKNTNANTEKTKELAAPSRTIGAEWKVERTRLHKQGDNFPLGEATGEWGWAIIDEKGNKLAAQTDDYEGDDGDFFKSNSCCAQHRNLSANTAGFGFP